MPLAYGDVNEGHVVLKTTNAQRELALIADLEAKANFGAREAQGSHFDLGDRNLGELGDRDLTVHVHREVDDPDRRFDAKAGLKPIGNLVFGLQKTHQRFGKLLEFDGQWHRQGALAVGLDLIAFVRTPFKQSVSVKIELVLQMGERQCHRVGVVKLKFEIEGHRLKRHVFEMHLLELEGWFLKAPPKHILQRSTATEKNAQREDEGTEPKRRTARQCQRMHGRSVVRPKAESQPIPARFMLLASQTLYEPTTKAIPALPWGRAVRYSERAKSGCDSVVAPERTNAMVSNIGQPAPELATSEWVQGEPTSLAKQRGHVVLVEVFQVNCPGCFLYSLPQSLDLHARYAEQGLSVIGLATAFEDYDKNTLENLRKLVGRQEVIGETHRALAELRRLNDGLLPYRLPYPVAMDRVVPDTEAVTEDRVRAYSSERVPGFADAAPQMQQQVMARVQAYLSEKKNTAETFETYALQGTPSSIVVDRSGILRDVSFGQAPHLETLIQKLLDSPAQNAPSPLPSP